MLLNVVDEEEVPAARGTHAAGSHGAKPRGRSKQHTSAHTTDGHPSSGRGGIAKKTHSGAGQTKRDGAAAAGPKQARAGSAGPHAKHFFEIQVQSTSPPQPDAAEWSLATRPVSSAAISQGAGAAVEAAQPRARLGRRLAREAHAKTSTVASVRRSDPARAAALPATLPLGGRSGKDGTEDRTSGRDERLSTFSRTRFDELPLDVYLKKQLEKLGLGAMTPVQRAAIPTLLDGRDLLVRSPTGSGKTLAYAVPCVQKLVSLGLSQLTRKAGTLALVVLPTRELVVQTHETLAALCRPYPQL
eukprot:2099942-Pleurochrysis_carterae.AAC.1